MATLRDKINGHLGHVVTIIVLLLSLGASYGVMQTKVSQLDKEDQRIEAGINERLNRIENKLDQLLLQK